MDPQARDRIPSLVAIIVLLIGILPAIQSFADEPAEQVTFTGKVVDKQGQPVEGANVTFYEIHQGQIYLRYVTEVLHELTTGSDGTFSYSATKYEGYRPVIVVVRKEGLALGWIDWRVNKDRQEEIVLGEPKQLRGIVVDTDGTPISGADVFIAEAKTGKSYDESEHLSTPLSGQIFNVKTDTSGRFRLDDLPEEASVEFGVKKQGYATLLTLERSQYYQESYQFVPGQSDIKLVMPPEAVVEGMVIEQDSGRPVAGVMVEIQNSQIVPTLRPDPIASGSDGSFKFDGLPAGTHVVSVTFPRDSVADWVASPVSVTLQAGQTKDDVKLQVSKGGLLEVVITEAGANKPLEGASISVQALGQRRQESTSSDANGIVKMRLVPGSYQLSGVFASGYQYSQPQESFTIEPDKTRRLTAQLNVIPMVRGVVRDPDGDPVKGAVLNLLPGGHEGKYSDAQGRFEVPWEPRGWDRDDTVFCLMARDEQRNLAVAVEVGGSTETLELTLKPGSTLTGTIVDPTAKPIPEAQLYVMLRVSSWGSTISRERLEADENGKFEINAIPPDHSYEITAYAKGYGKSSTQAETHEAAGQTIDVGEMTLPVADLSISGQIVDTQGNPVPKANIRVYGSNQPNNCRTTSNDEGNFVLDGVCAGEIQLNIDATYKGQRLSANVITNGQIGNVHVVARQGPSPVQYFGSKTYDQIIKTAEKIIAGVAIDEQGQPVANVPVGVCCHRTERGWRFSSFSTLKATTDEQGCFAIELEEDGQYNLRFSPDHHAAVIAYDIPVGTKDLKVTLSDGGTLTGCLVQLEIEGKLPIAGVELKLEQADRAAYTHLGFDRDRTTTTDAAGRFRFEHIQTETRPSSSRQEVQWEPVPRIWQLSYGDITQTVNFADGDVMEDFEFLIRPSLDDSTSLVGRTLPALEGIEIDSAAAVKDKAVVVCFFDYQQRPSRNAVMKLALQTEGLQAKGIEIIAIQVTEVDHSTLDTWVKKNSFTFPVGMITGNVDIIRAAWNVKSLPWLILADKDHTVQAEGFTIDELEAKVKEMTDVDP